MANLHIQILQIVINCILRCLCSCICGLATHFDIYLVFILSFSTMLYNLLYDNLKKTHHWDNELRLIHHYCSFLSLVVSTSPPTSLIVQETSTRLRVKTYSSSLLLWGGNLDNLYGQGSIFFPFSRMIVLCQSLGSLSTLKLCYSVYADLGKFRL